MALHYVLSKHLALLIMQVSRQELSRQLLILNENLEKVGKMQHLCSHQMLKYCCGMKYIPNVYMMLLNVLRDYISTIFIDRRL